MTFSVWIENRLAPTNSRNKGQHHLFADKAILREAKDLRFVYAR
jgi:hypothetical protein